MKIVIANSNPIHSKLESFFVSNYNATIISNSNDLTVDFLKELNPDYVFFPHWSTIIPNSIFDNYECVVFHMTDLPYGRGGSPLQNLIVRNFSETKLTALKVVKELDAGDIYLKEDLSLIGNADEIFLRVSSLIVSMIIKIIETKIKPTPQVGEVVNFKRRKPSDGNIYSIDTLEKVYDYIRMLDSDNYPSAFLESEKLKFEFTRASFKGDKIIADVRISKK